MHAATLGKSPRLRRVLAVLCDGREHSTRDLVIEANVCAVNSIIAELRANGFLVTCRTVTDDHGERRWLYRLEAA